MYGVAVQSKFVAIGGLTLWARADAGAVATQAWINTAYGARSLELLASGLSAAATLEELTDATPLRAHRHSWAWWAPRALTGLGDVWEPIMPARATSWSGQR
jgi:Family of unknown function (DUF1028)